MGWKVLYMRCDEWDDDVDFDCLVLLGGLEIWTVKQGYNCISFHLELGMLLSFLSTISISWPVGISLKGVSIVTFLLLLDLGGSWNDEPVVTLGGQLALSVLQMLSFSCISSHLGLDDIRASSFQYFTHCPCQPFQFYAILFLWKESNLFFHF